MPAESRVPISESIDVKCVEVQGVAEATLGQSYTCAQNSPDSKEKEYIKTTPSANLSCVVSACLPIMDYPIGFEHPLCV